ncbi:MAG: ABC transporter substrate-binding protein [Propionibacteriaceae bacterium]|jgi:peptide/nickel transport system substrate-binding protein|nr:ABC transporter substrate-binding protein [Propionibacteriaceae bacterium]
MKPTIRPSAPRPRFGRRLLHRAVAVGLSGLLLAGLAACSGSPDPTPSGSTASGPVEGGELVWAIETDITTINPHRNGQDKANPILSNAFSPYLYRNGAGEFEPWIAAGYEVSSDGLQVTLNLRDNVTFSDGAKLDAAAAKLNIDKVSDPAAGYVTSIPGGLRFLESVEVVDPLTLRFTLSKADIQFLLFLSTTHSSPLSPATFDLPQTVLEPGGPQLAGVGPFTIESFIPSTELVFVKRADYAWAPDSIAQGHPAPYLDKVTYRTLKEGSTRTGALQQGQVDVASDIQPIDAALFQGDARFQYLRLFVGGTPYAYYLNVSQPPFDDIRVRQAFVLGADYPAIIASIYQGVYERAWAPVSEVGPFADPALDGWAKVDLDKANQLLDEAGWTERDSDGVRIKDGQRLTVRNPSAAPFIRESRDQLAVAIGAALRQNIGLEYSFEPFDLGTSTEQLDNNQYGLFDNSYGGADPVTGIDLLYFSSDRTRGFIAYGRYDDPELESLIDQGRFTTDLASRKATYLQFQAYVTEHYYVLPLYQTQDNLAARSGAHGFTQDSGTGQLVSAATIWIDR